MLQPTSSNLTVFNGGLHFLQVWDLGNHHHPQLFNHTLQSGFQLIKGLDEVLASDSVLRCLQLADGLQ